MLIPFSARMACAEMSAAEFLRDIQINEHRRLEMMYLAGLTNGLGWFNSSLQAVGEKTLFCLTEKWH